MLLEALAGRIGSSDGRGSLTITPDPAGQRLDGALRSRSLRMSDLFAVASGGQLTRAHRSGRLLPDAAINAAPLRKLVGELHFSADSVQAPTTPTIRSLQTRITFNRGRVAADPLVLDLARGRAILHFVLDGRGSVPHVRFDADIQHADTADFMKTKAARAPLQAAFVGDIQLQGAGASLAEAAGHASGSLRMRALNGRLPQTQAAVLSADFVHGVASLLSKTPRDIAMRCAVASFQVVDGEARATSLKMSTDLGGVTGYGRLQPEDRDRGHDAAALGPAGHRCHVRAHRTDLLIHPHATLALDNPTGIVRHAVTGLLHPLRAVRPVESGCE